MGYWCIWNFNGPNSGTFTEAASQAAVDAAETAKSGQDARKWTGLQLLPPGTVLAGPLDPTTPPPPPEPAPQTDPEPAPCEDTPEAPDAPSGAEKGMQAGENYATRHFEAAPHKRGRGRPRKAA